jgi:hypothetical protein
VGEWSWALALLDEWLANEITGDVFLELFVDRAVLRALRGEDPTADLAAAEQLLPKLVDPQFTSYRHWARSWAAFTAGRLADAQQEAESAASVTNYFTPITLPIAARAALWAGDAPGAASIVAELAASISRGQAVALDVVTLKAGVAALEGRRSDAAAGYRDALRGWQGLGLAFDHALAVVDMAILLAPTESEMPDAPALVGAARETLRRLGARPFLDRLDASPSRDGRQLKDPRPLSPMETGVTGQSS